MAPWWRPSLPDWLSPELLFLTSSAPTLPLCWLAWSRNAMSSFTVCAISFEALLLYAVVVDDNLRRSPRLHLNNLAGNTPAVNASGRGRVKHLRTASKLLADVFGCLSRQDVDSYQLVCRGWRETIEEHAEHLSLRRLSVWLVSNIR